MIDKIHHKKASNASFVILLHPFDPNLELDERVLQYTSSSFVHNQFDQESECNKNQIFFVLPNSPSWDKKNEISIVINSNTTFYSILHISCFWRF